MPLSRAAPAPPRSSGTVLMPDVMPRDCPTPRPSPAVSNPQNIGAYPLLVVLVEHNHSPAATSTNAIGRMSSRSASNRASHPATTAPITAVSATGMSIIPPVVALLPRTVWR